MAFSISNGWDVAHHHVHEGIKHIGNACSINLTASSKYSDWESALEWPSLLAASMDVRQYSVEEHKQCLKAVVLFQAGMEAWISWAYSRPQLSGKSLPRNFVDKWTEALDHFSTTHDFSGYADFYRQVRNPIVHPTSEADVLSIAAIWSDVVHKGLKQGWGAMEALSSNLAQPFDRNSWSTMCGIHHVPPSLDSDALINLHELERSMRAKHLSGARGELQND